MLIVALEGNLRGNTKESMGFKDVSKNTEVYTKES